MADPTQTDPDNYKVVFENERGGFAWRAAARPHVGLPAEAPAQADPSGCLAAGLGHVQGNGGANESLQGLFVNAVALVKIDGAPDLAFEAGVEEA